MVLMMMDSSRYGRAISRLEAAIAQLETSLDSSLQARPEMDAEELSRLSAALRAAEQENDALVQANRRAAERLEQTIGRLRGLLTS